MKFKIEEQLDRIECCLLLTKNVLSVKDVAFMLGVSEGHVYRLTSQKKIPFYKPQGKVIYFNREEVEKWALQNRVTPKDEIEEEASRRVLLNKNGVALI